MTRRQFLALILPLLFVLLAFVTISLVERMGAVGSPSWDDGFSRYVRNQLAYEFVGGVDDEREVWQAYFNAHNAWVQTFDSYAAVVPPWELEESREESSGQYPGIGIRTKTPDPGKPAEGLEITGVKPGGPADTAGIVVGDVIVEVSGRAVGEISPDGDFTPLERAIRGPTGTRVALRVRAPDGDVRDVDVVRAAIDSGSVFGARLLDAERGIGYVRLSGFMLDTASTFRERIAELEKAGLRALVLDLRQNNGGLLPQAVEVADAFLTTGIIVRVRGRDEDFTETYRATKAGTVVPSMPVVVLTNHYSASASEVLAGALHDHRRALLVGERTYGKFLVQTVEERKMEIGTALFKRTTAVYETPLGKNYQRRYYPDRTADPLAGIEPDVYVPVSEEELTELRRVFREESFADWNPAWKPEPTDFVDRALQAAMALLRGETPAPRLLPEAE